MPDREAETELNRNSEARNPARRSMIVGSGAALVGGLAGGAAVPNPAVAQEAKAAPELPWPWVTIDPMEAGSRTYNAYLTQGG